VSDALAASIGTDPGMYMFPTGGLTKQSSGEEEEKGMERMMEEMKTKPSGLLVYKPAGSTFNFGKSLAIEFLTDFAIAFIAVLLLAQTRIVTFGGRVGFVVMIGLLAAIAAHVPHWNWYSFPGAYALANMFMAIVAMFLAGLVIAAIYKPAQPDR
jgi:pheromone shutdown protein TraB